MNAHAISEEFELSDAEIEAMLSVGSPRRSTSAWEPPSIAELQPGLPQLELIELVARGGMGAVYKGVQKSLNRLVAIKVLPPDMARDPSFAERFKEEALSMAKLSHPGIVSVYDAGKTKDGLLYFMMEFVEGTDVAHLIEQEHRIEPKQALEITVAVCEALAYAHDSGVIHRDIKPSNIMLDRHQRVKITDFGLAKQAEETNDERRTRSRVTIGTPDFLAPEALTTDAVPDHRMDLYSVGVTLYQMLTGHIPRGSFALPSVVVPAVDSRVDAIVERALKSDRELRYSTAVQLRTEVLAVLDTKASPSAPALPAQRFRLTWATAAVAVLAALALASTSWKTENNHASPPAPKSPIVTGDAPSLPPEELKELLSAAPLPPPEVICDLPRGRWAGLCATEEEFPGLIKEGTDRWQRLASKTFIPKKADGLNWGVRATFRNTSTETPPQLVARNTHTANYHAYVSAGGKELIIQRYDATQPKENRYPVLAREVLQKPVPQSQPYTLEFFAIGRQLVARLGEAVVQHKLPALDHVSGRFGIYGSELDDFRDVQFLNLDGLNAPDALQLARLTEEVVLPAPAL